ncbi:hypothetical protein GCM10023205_74010 [Yinghuangia aomiensis]|uniref:C2H2-type domain-containing protein n=1 Tax=Yinghuangia aomiensis TaxID=676205 RepID=A0ABP9I972_9ACTN
MIRIRLGKRKYVGNGGEKTPLHPFLVRQLTGWDPTMTEQDVYDAARGWWKLSERAEREQYAVIVGDGVVRMVVQIGEWATNGDRRGFAGILLQPGQPIHDALIGSDDPAPTTSRNPVAYFRHELEAGICRCGCNEPVPSGDWVQGHDQRALHQLVNDDFGGSVSRFLDWYEELPAAED